MNRPFASRLFVRVFSATAAVVALLFAAMYLLSVPFMQDTVESIEEHTAKTVLNEVYESVEETSRSLQNYRQGLIVARKQELRDVLSIVGSRIEWLERQVRTGHLGHAQARNMVLDELRHAKYGRADYVWAADYRSFVVSHPDPKIEGADFSQQRDVRGNLIVPPVVEGALAHGDGFHSYWWRRLGEEQPIEKLTYYRNVPFFKLVLATGIYLDDIESAFETGRAAAIDDLRQRLRKTRLARTGYLYVFDGALKMHIHPNANIENRNFGDMIEPVSHQPLAPMLIASADKPEGLRYKWDKPEDPGNYVYDKISWVRHSSDFDWYVASSVYVDELGESAHVLRNRTMAIFAAALLLALGMAYLLVKRLIAPLKDSVDHLDTRVRERTAELEEANARLLELDRMKSEFLSSVSHELRTPLTSIRGFASLIEREFERSFAVRAEGDENSKKPVLRIRENLKIVLKESERLTRLIDDVLDLAQIEAGRMKWSDRRVQMAEIIRDAIESVRPAFEQKPEVELTLDVDANLPPFVADGDRLQQVMVNLLGNAIKFTDRGSVAVKANLNAEGWIEVEVADTGIGFPPEDAEAIFDKFQQSRQGDTLLDRPKGTGLGLAICREIMTRHGGRIVGRSKPGEGSTFNVAIPIAGAHASAPA